MKLATVALLTGAAFAAPVAQQAYGPPPAGYYPPAQYNGPPPQYSGPVVYSSPAPRYSGYRPGSLLGNIAGAAGNVLGNVVGGLADGIGGVGGVLGDIVGGAVGLGKDLTDAIVGALPWTVRYEEQLNEIRAAIAPINAKYAQVEQEQKEQQ